MSDCLLVCSLTADFLPKILNNKQSLRLGGNSILQTREIPGVLNESIAGFLTAQVLQTHYDSETERICLSCLWCWIIAFGNGLRLLQMMRSFAPM